MAERRFDVIVAGAGPAGSSCARFLSTAGLRVAMIDRATFPRVKLCAGWLSNPVWDALEIDPAAYDQSLWKWDRCHVHFGDRCHQVEVDGYFIRRFEFDDFLVRQSGAELIEHNIKTVTREDGLWIIDNQFAAPIVVGAAGTHCPIARAAFAKRAHRPAGARELEFLLNPRAIEATRIGLDGEPELFLHSDLRGYSWNIPKTGWLNVGTGTLEAKQVHEAWAKARDVFSSAGHLPQEANEPLEKMKGHSYYLFEPSHLERSHHDNALLVGDSLGLAHPLTAEGILPAVTSARLAADAIIAGSPASYTTRLRSHSLFREYSTLWRLRDTGGALRGGEKNSSRSEAQEGPEMDRPQGPASAALGWAIARGFAWMFAGRPLPGHRVIDPFVRFARRWDRLVSADVRGRRPTHRAQQKSSS